MNKTPTRSEYKVFYPILTRWKDNDTYGHVNNVEYYSYFDTVVNLHLIKNHVLDIHESKIIGFVVNSGCTFVAPVAYPDSLEVGLRVEKLGRSSTQYGVAIFKDGAGTASAYGHLVHVFVDRSTNKSVAIPDNIRSVLEDLYLEDIK
ncbi:MAG: thioesterase family protein [Desulfuromonadales bacterium]